MPARNLNTINARDARRTRGRKRERLSCPLWPYARVPAQEPLPSRNLDDPLSVTLEHRIHPASNDERRLLEAALRELLPQGPRFTVVGDGIIRVESG